MSTTVKLSDYLARRVAELGVTHVFMVTGGGAIHLNDSFGGRDDLAYVCCHHEQACAIAVEGFDRNRVRAQIEEVKQRPNFVVREKIGL